MKKIAIFLLTAILLTSFFGVSSFAAVPSQPIVQPLWTNTITFDTTISIDDETDVKTGTASLKVIGMFGADRIVGEIQIYRISGGEWIPYKYETKTVYSNNFSMEVTFDCIARCSYKVSYTATVYRNGVGETITRNLYDTCH